MQSSYSDERLRKEVKGKDETWLRAAMATSLQDGVISTTELEIYAEALMSLGQLRKASIVEMLVRMPHWRMKILNALMTGDLKIVRRGESIQLSEHELEWVLEHFSKDQLEQAIEMFPSLDSHILHALSSLAA